MAMKRSRKIALIIGAALVVVIAVSVVVQRRKAGVVAVQMGDVKRQDLVSVVTASGEVRPRNYVNINSQSFGKIIEIAVKEGERVRKGQVLLRMEAVQPAAEVEASRAGVASAQAAVAAAEASLKTAQAELQRSRADFERARLNWERAQGLHRDQLISQAEYDTRKADYESAEAGVAVAEARGRQTQAELDRARSTHAQTQANLTRVSDVLQKTIYTSPIDGVVTNLPVHEGEQMVPGILNSPGSFLMTVADMVEV
ncbi:MAG: biotin/lipoyl-binding protein, partial [Acidobacteria bacterium]|nr:biotin/lipoyl-binding protein [Acidobacteriota bacterium]